MKYRISSKNLCSDAADTSRRSIGLASSYLNSAASRSHCLFTLNEEHAGDDKRAADDRDD